MHLAAITICAALFILPASLPAAAQTDKSWETCIATDGTAATRLPACTDLIENRKVEGRRLAGALCIRGNDLTEKGDLDAALADLNEAIKLDSTYACAFSNRGRVYGLQRDF